MCEDGDVRIINDAKERQSEGCIIDLEGKRSVQSFETAIEGPIEVCFQNEERQSEGCIIDLEGKRSVQSFETAIEGRIEVCFQNVWGAIYDANFTNKDAAVACHQLHYSRSGNAS